MKLIFVYGTAVLLWASAFPAIRASLGYYSPEHLAALRLLIASAALLLFALAARIPLPKRKDMPAIFLLGICGFSVYHGALSIGEKTVEAGTASLLVSTTPLFSTLLAALFMKERLHLKNGIAALIAFLGIGIIMLGSGASFHLQLGALIILVGAFGESIYFVFSTPPFADIRFSATDYLCHFNRDAIYAGVYPGPRANGVSCTFLCQLDRFVLRAFPNDYSLFLPRLCYGKSWRLRSYKHFVFNPCRGAFACLALARGDTCPVVSCRRCTHSCRSGGCHNW